MFSSNVVEKSRHKNKNNTINPTLSPPLPPSIIVHEKIAPLSVQSMYMAIRKQLCQSFCERARLLVLFTKNGKYCWFNHLMLFCFFLFKSNSRVIFYVFTYLRTCYTHFVHLFQCLILCTSLAVLHKRFGCTVYLTRVIDRVIDRYLPREVCFV